MIDYKQLLIDNDIIVTGSHFIYTSGRHGSSYINKNKIIADPVICDSLMDGIASLVADIKVDCIVGPALGGIIFSHLLAKKLTQKHKKLIYSVFAEKEANNFLIKRNFDKYIINKNVIVVEDIITTGISTKNVVELLKKMGANVTAVVCICNRGNVTNEQVGTPPLFYSLLDLKLQDFLAANCPLCAKGIELNKTLGHA